MDVITYPWCDLSQSMVAKGAIGGCLNLKLPTGNLPEQEIPIRKKPPVIMLKQGPGHELQIYLPR